MGASKKLTAQQRIDRARLAGRVSHQSPERHVRALERLGQELTPDQANRLTKVLLTRLYADR